MDYFTMEPMKYWSFPASKTPDERIKHLEKMIIKDEYIYSQKFDGNWCRVVLTKERKAIQTRGISKKTGEYGEIQEKVTWWGELVNALSDLKDTVFLGEVCMEGGRDKDVGTILRCLPQKALARQALTPLTLHIFDVLVYDGENLMDSPITERIKFIDVIVNKVNNNLIYPINYYPMDDKFFDNLEEIFSNGGEGVVCYKKDSIYVPGKRGPHAWDTLKVKQEIQDSVDCFVYEQVAPEKYYTGKQLKEWMFWEDAKSGKRLLGYGYNDYLDGANIFPVTKNYFYGWCGSLGLGVYDKKGNIYPLCKISHLTDEEREDIKKNYDEKWHLRPVSIRGMMISQNQKGEFSIRHPIIEAWRDGDINIKDCTLQKIVK